jgi:exodeoxyribonuclease VII small subunit
MTSSHTPSSSSGLASPDISGLPFEKAMSELEMIVSQLEQGDVPLEQSITLYTRGEALKSQCEKLLRAAEARVEKITLDAVNQPTGTAPLDAG